MLIKALYDYASYQKNTVPKGYCKQKVDFEIVLNTSGKVVNIIDIRQRQETEIPSKKKGNPPRINVDYLPIEYIFPEREQTTKIYSYKLDHRPVYIFGLIFKDGVFTVEPITEKKVSKKSKKNNDDSNERITRHKSFTTHNEEFFKDLTSDICVAYYNFIKTWNPELEIENEHLLKIKKSYNKASFCFGLEGHPEILLHEDEQFKQKYEESLTEDKTKDGNDLTPKMCAITGEVLPIARLHDNIDLKNKPKPQCKIVCMDKGSYAFQSYGKEEAYNSNVSEKVMKVYTSTLNDLLDKDNHNIIIDDMTIVYFAIKPNDDAECDLLTGLTLGNLNQSKESTKIPTLLSDFTLCNKTYDKNTASATNDTLTNRIFRNLINGTVKDLSTFNIDEDVTFYVFGLTPNNSRISQKFIYKDNFGNIIKNIVQHQKDMAMSKKAVEDGKPVTFRDIFKELISPNSTSEKVSSPLMSAVMLSAFQGTEYPNALLENVVRRVKIDQDNKDNKDKQNKYIKMNDVRVGIIKGYINRNLRLKGNKEEFQMSLDLENRNPAYLCGRMFAVCEKIQMEALGKELNQTIKDSYFASACASPSVVFPNLLKLSQNHLANIRKKSPVDKNPSVYYQIIMGEIMDKLVGEFPSTLSLEDQGRFIIGYYHQYRDFFVSKKTENN